MVFRIGWISMGGQLSCEFGEKPASITESGGWRQTRRAVWAQTPLRPIPGVAVAVAVAVADQESSAILN